MVKKEALFIVLFLLAISSVSAVSFNCPSSAEANSQFSITVSHAGAEQVAFYDYLSASWNWQTGSSYTYTVTASSAQPRLEYFGDAKVSGNNVCTTPCSCFVEIIESNYPTSITINAPQGVESGQTFNILVTVSDNNGVDHFELRKGVALEQILGTKDCSGSTTCSQTFTTSITTETTFQVNSWDSNANTASQTATVGMSTPNSPPSFSTSSLPAASVGVPYSAQVVASDVDGDSIVYSLVAPIPTGMTISSNVISWTPSSTGTFDITVKADDETDFSTFDYTVTVNPSACVPACAGKVCGPDGCGGVCGTCTSGQTCTSGVCVVTDLCAGISCTSPPNTLCYLPSGTCSAGTCSYTKKAVGTSCGTGLKCSVSGTCELTTPVCIDADDDGYAVGSDLSSCSDYSEPDCNDNDPSIHPGATEICKDNINQNCNEVVDDASLCESAGSCMVDPKRADFTSPTTSRFKINQAVQFAASGSGITSYDWDFGNGQSSSTSSGSTSYSSAGTFTVRLRTVDDNDCPAVKTKTITIFECQSNSDCAQGVCENEKCSIPPNADEPLSVSITSPTSRQYTTKELLLIADTNKPAENKI